VDKDDNEQERINRMMGVILSFQHFVETKDACSLDILQNAVWELLNDLATEAVGDQASHLLETVLESFADEDAHQPQQFASTHWTVEDILDRFEVTTEVAESFLRANQKEIVEAMVSAGGELIEDLGALKGFVMVEDDDNDDEEDEDN
jgi:hypothetical protein